MARIGIIFIFTIVCSLHILLPAIVAAPTAKGDGHAGDKKLICYYSSWSSYRPSVGAFTIDDIPVHLCTHVVYAFIGLNNRTWELLVLDPTNDITKGGYRRFTSLKKRNSHLKTLISVGGWVEGGQKYSEMVSKPERRKIFVNSVVDFLKWFNFDGLDLDWEFPGSPDRHGRAEDKENFVQLVKELRDAFDKEGWGWTLTAVVPIMRFRVEGGYDVPQLSSMLDHIHLLTYDLRGNWTGFTDVHAPLRARQFDLGDYEGVNMNDGSQLWQQLGAPVEKLTIGLPLYGRTYTLADVGTNGLHSQLNRQRTAGSPGPYTKANGTLAYYEICELFKSGGWEQKYDNLGESPYMVKGDQWIGYDDRHSLIEKVKFVQEKGFGGVAVWSVDLDDFRGVCGESRILLHSIYKQLTGKSPLALPQPGLSGQTTMFAPSTLPPATTEPNFVRLQTDVIPRHPSQELDQSNEFVSVIPMTPSTATASHSLQFTTEAADHTDNETPPSLSIVDPTEDGATVVHQNHFRSTVSPVFRIEVFEPSSPSPISTSDTMPPVFRIDVFEKNTVPSFTSDSVPPSATSPTAPHQPTHPDEPRVLFVQETTAIPEGFSTANQNTFASEPIHSTEDSVPRRDFDHRHHLAVTPNPPLVETTRAHIHSSEHENIFAEVSSPPTSTEEQDSIKGTSTMHFLDITTEDSTTPNEAFNFQKVNIQELQTRTIRPDERLRTTSHLPVTPEAATIIASSEHFGNMPDATQSTEQVATTEQTILPLNSGSGLDHQAFKGDGGHLAAEGIKTGVTDHNETNVENGNAMPSSRKPFLPPKERITRPVKTQTEQQAVQTSPSLTAGDRPRNRTSSKRVTRPLRRKSFRRKTTTTTSSVGTEDVPLDGSGIHDVTGTPRTTTNKVITRTTTNKIIGRRPVRPTSPESVDFVGTSSPITTTKESKQQRVPSRRPFRRRLRTRKTTPVTTATHLSVMQTTESQQNDFDAVPETATVAEITRRPIRKVRPQFKRNVTVSKSEAADEEEEAEVLLTRPVGNRAAGRNINNVQTSGNRFDLPTVATDREISAQSGTVDDVFTKFAPPSHASSPSEIVEYVNVKSRREASDDAPECAEGETYSSHRMCDKYWWCIHGRASLKECEMGLVWNPETNNCDWTASVERDDCE